MKKNMVVTIWFSLCSAAMAFDPMGPSTPAYKFTRTGVALEYCWTEIDIEAEGIPEIGLGRFTIKNAEAHKFYANFGAGVHENGELFLRLGLGELEGESGENSDTTFLCGGGVKFNIITEEKYKWGLLIQTGWGNYVFEEDAYILDGFTVSWEEKIDVFEVQLATGPTYELSENVLLYGGPFFHWVRGEDKIKGTVNGSSAKAEIELEEDSVFGGYIGTQLKLNKTTDLSVEFQATGSGQGVAVSLRHRF